MVAKPDDLLVLRFLANRPNSSANEIAEGTGLSAWVVRQKAKHLDESCLIDRIGGTVAYRGNRFTKVWDVSPDGRALLQANP